VQFALTSTVDLLLDQMGDCDDSFTGMCYGSYNDGGRRQGYIYIMRPGSYTPKWVLFGKKKLLTQGVQLFVAVPMVPRGTLRGAYRRTYPHLYAWYRGWVGAMCGTSAVLSRLLGAAKKKYLGGYDPGRMIYVSTQLCS
jgi:hypothetical protein